MPSSRSSKNTALLDSLRFRHGNSQLCEIFHNRCTRGGEDPSALLDDERLSFPALFLLWPEIRKKGLEPALNARNAKALEIASSCVSRGGAYMLEPDDAPVLRWMLRTGHAEDGVGAQYDAVMDGAAILLAREHGDRACLPYIARMIFSRHRIGHYTKDAEWALFESRDPAALELAARGLLSDNGADVALARRLLGFIPCFEGPAGDPARQYRCAMRWLERNRGRLEYTGLGSQQGPNPRRFAVSGASGKKEDEEAGYDRD